MEEFTGADKNTLIQLPKEGEITDADHLSKIHGALGVPADGKYEAYQPESGDVQIPEAELSAFDGLCGKNGVTPGARKAMLDFFHEVNDQAKQTLSEQHTQAVEAQKAEWRGAYGQRFEAAKNALSKIEGGAEVLSMFEAQNIADNPQLVKFGYALSQLVREDGAHGAGTGSEVSMTPKQARQAFDKFNSENYKILTGQEGTPYDKKRAMEERDRLARMMTRPSTV